MLNRHDGPKPQTGLERSLFKTTHCQVRSVSDLGVPLPEAMAYVLPPKRLGGRGRGAAHSASVAMSLDRGNRGLRIALLGWHPSGRPADRDV